MVRKGEIACNKQFLLLSPCFLPYVTLTFHFKCTLKCRLQFVSIFDQSKILSSGNGLSQLKSVVSNCCQYGQVMNYFTGATPLIFPTLKID